MWTAILIGVGSFGFLVGAFLPYMIRDFKHKKWLAAENKKKTKAAQAARDEFRAKLAEDARNGVGVYIQQVGRALRTKKGDGTFIGYEDSLKTKGGKKCD